MKRKLFALVLILNINCTHQHKKTASNNHIKKDLNELLNNWHLAASKADFNNYMNAMDSVAIFVGTDATEHWTKDEFKTFSKPYFDKGTAWSFTPLHRNIYISKSKKVVWFDELLTTWMGTCRGSGVLEKINHKWKIQHYVLSVAIPNDDMKSIIAVKKHQDSLFLSSFQQK